MLLPYRDVYEGSRALVDGVGALLFAVGTGALLLVTAVQENRLLWAACGLLILAVFVLHERRHPAPMIPGRMFRRRTVVWILVNNFLVCLSMFGLSNYVPLYLQDIGYSVLYSGLTLICISAGWMTLSVFSGKWILRYGYRPLLLLGNGCCSRPPAC